MAPGRPTKGSDIVTRFDASDEAKEKVQLVLDTLSGKTSLQDAAARLGVSESRFHQIREEILLGMLNAAEPKPVGRPPKPQPQDDEAARLKNQLAEAKLELHVSRLRELLAIAYPHLVQREAERRKKKRKSRIVTDPGSGDSEDTSSSS